MERRSQGARGSGPNGAPPAAAVLARSPRAGGPPGGPPAKRGRRLQGLEGQRRSARFLLGREDHPDLSSSSFSNTVKNSKTPWRFRCPRESSEFILLQPRPGPDYVLEKKLRGLSLASRSAEAPVARPRVAEPGLCIYIYIYVYMYMYMYMYIYIYIYIYISRSCTPTWLHRGREGPVLG